MRPNVLLVVLDTARADAFEPYGAPPGASPAIAQMARRGSALDPVYAPAGWTLPSHVGMFSGLMPRSVGLGQAPGGPQAARAVMEGLRPRLLPEVLHHAGYETAGISANPWISPQSGFDIGFDRFTLLTSPRVHPGEGRGRRLPAEWSTNTLAPRLDDGARAIEQHLGAWLRSRHSNPFFWFVNLIECHSPYFPPRPYNDLPVVQRFLAARDARRYGSMEAVWRACLGGFDLEEATLRRMRHLYARSVRQVDDWVGRVLAGLDGAGVLDETLVIVTSDHGENIGEGGLISHAFSLDERLLRVPLVSAGPGAPAARRLTSLVELPRLVAEATGLTTTPWMDDPAPRGVAVAEYDPMIPPGDPLGDEVVRLWRLGPGAIHRFTTPMTCATDGRFKLLRDGHLEQLYDLRADPLEAAPLTEPAAISALAGDALAPLRAALDRPAERMEPPVVVPPAPPAADEQEALERQMRLLGYL